MNWLLTSNKMSLVSAVRQWAIQVRMVQIIWGLATGGKVCVANIKICCTFSDVIYSQNCKYLPYLYIFIVHGTGWIGTPIQFFRWFC